MRSAKASRKTNETEVEVKLTLEGTGNTDINTGVPFLDHMLNSLAAHGSLDLSVKAVGDLAIDDHHTVEDIGITFGNAIAKALGDKKGISRFGEAMVPMDEALATVALDISGRGYLVFDAPLSGKKVGGLSTQMVRHFFESMVNSAGITAHMHVSGDNDHHKVEALFKAFGVALKRAFEVKGSKIPSTKGVI